MRRRDLLLGVSGAIALCPLRAPAQPATPVVGCVFIGSPGRSVWWVEPWRKALAASGFVEGRNLEVDYKWGDGDVSRLPGFVADLVARRAAAIVTTSLPAVLAAKEATATIPIVFNFVDDPVGKGLVKSFAQPGGNITGVANEDIGALESKRLQLLREVVPRASRIGYLFAVQDAAPRRRERDAVEAAGRTLGVEVVPLPVGTVEEVDTALAKAKQRGIGAVLVQNPSTFLYAQQKRLTDAIARYAMPAASGLTDFAAGGGLIWYSSRPAEAPALTATYVARILKGQKPADLPVQTATTFELQLNLKTARALGLTFSLTLLGSADAVFE